LGKIVNALDEQQPAHRCTSRSTSVITDHPSPEEEKTVMEEPSIKEEDEESDGTVVPKEEKDERESLVDDLLSDGEDVEMTDV
jgi:condensin complex subunit 3